MFYTIPTKRGLGLELWGTSADLEILHDIIGKFWQLEGHQSQKGFENRDTLISGFSYEVRKAFQGSRLKRDQNHLFPDGNEYVGCQLSWVHILFSIRALRYNMSYAESTKLDLGIFLQLEYWIERSMYAFDETGAGKLAPYISDGIYAENELLYQFMRRIDAEYFALGGGKAAFRKLPQLLKKASFFTEEFKAYNAHLHKEAKRLHCEADALELDEDESIYSIGW
ncbi:MAG: hypothetical protein WC716_11830 [Chitinophagaceae bacterium]|jgi:hypothetical protein